MSNSSPPESAAAQVAIVGRPNVGKSALFNRLAGRRIAIVHAQPGVTRDRICAEVEWRGRAFTVVDTGGIGLMPGETSPDKIIAAAREQADIAIRSAAVLILTTDASDGVTPLDEEIARLLRASGRAVLVAVNKVDNPRTESGVLAEFSRLGFEPLLAVSAIHGHGVSELLDAVVLRLPTTGGGGSRPAGSPTGSPGGVAIPAGVPTRIAVVGRPNVGKSSLINALLREPRLIVSEIPGTTRDAVDVPFWTESDGVRRAYVLIDTAGIRPKRKIPDSVDFFSVRRAQASIRRCDLALLVLDAEQGITAQDKKIGGEILQAHKACVLVVNKWDLVGQRVQKRFIEGVRHILFFLDFAPVVFLSAKTGLGLPRLLETVRFVQSQLQQEVPTPVLNRVLQDALAVRPPPSRSGARGKLFYAVQQKRAPHTFVLFVNRTDLFEQPYRKYLADVLRKHFGFEGCPLVLQIRNRPRTIEPKREFETRSQHRP